MEIYRLEYSNYKMFNPTSGEVIVDEECNDAAKSLIAYWLDIIFENPIIKDDKLDSAWKSFVSKFIDGNNCYPHYDNLTKFLEDYDTDSWISYKISSYGIACGPVYSTVLFVVNKEVIVEEIYN